MEYTLAEYKRRELRRIYREQYEADCEERYQEEKERKYEEELNEKGGYKGSTGNCQSQKGKQNGSNERSCNRDWRIRQRDW